MESQAAIKEHNETDLEEGSIVLRRCAYDKARICDRSCISLETVTERNVYGNILYEGSYCMRGGFKIGNLFI